MPTKTILPLAVALWMAAGQASAQTYAPWLTQIGVSETVASAANWGKKQILGVVDTGIVASHPVFAAGQVSIARSACAGVTFSCATGIYDDNSHGTAVAAIAAGSGTIPYASYYGGAAVARGSVVSVAPYANIVAQKVFAAGAQSTFTDVANGISRAADAGASVINVSITYWNGPEVVSAINYAASKGSFIVWAGGNDGTVLLNGANTYGLTPAAIKQLVFAGAVNSANQLTYFSNRPGSAALVNTSGGTAALRTRWVVAPGEGILAPWASYGPNEWASWSGTSMAAPIVSGSLILLESAWPILKTRRTAATLLLATTTDIGASGADATYGSGLVNLQKAFRPYGTLVVTKASGGTIAVSSLTGSMITGGALGSFSTVKSKLSNYTALDGYARDFSVNLSGLIQTRPTSATVNRLPAYAPSGPQPMQFDDTARDPRVGYASHTDASGTSIAFGYGYPSQFAYARALYANETFARMSGDLGVSNLAALAQGGGMLAYGMQLSEPTRIAFSWSGTASVLHGTPAAWNDPWTHPDASTAGVGVSHRFSERFTAGVSFGTLNENHGLLGTLYDAASALSLGASNRSRSYGFSAAYQLDQRNSVLFEAGFSTTEPAAATGLFVGTTELRARAYGVTFARSSLLADEDRLMLTVRRPLRVVSGQAGVVVPHIDEQGEAHYHTEWTSLVPTGREVHYGLAYDRPLGKTQSVGFQYGYRRDALNVEGSKEISVGATWNLKF